jgi:hypothetical protein
MKIELQKKLYNIDICMYVPFGQVVEPGVVVVLTQKYLKTKLGPTNPAMCRISDLL